MLTQTTLSVTLHLLNNNVPRDVLADWMIGYNVKNRYLWK